MHESVERAAYFARSAPGEYLPLGRMRSRWHPDQLPGPAITGLLTHGAVEAVDSAVPGRRLIRIAYDLHSVALLRPTLVRSRVFKTGRRAAFVDVVLEQEGREVAGARACFAVPLESPENELWSSVDRLASPAVGQPLDEFGRAYHAPGIGWTANRSAIPGAERKSVWLAGSRRPEAVNAGLAVAGSATGGVELVAGERTSGVVLAGLLSDNVNLVASWGGSGVQHINVDATLGLAREPEGDGVGLRLTRVVESAGVLTASAEVFDRVGAVGVATVTAIAQAQRVDIAR